MILSYWPPMNFFRCWRVLCMFVCPAPCGSRSTGSEGTVLSPNFPRNYTAGHSCVYSISVPREFGMNALLFTTNTNDATWCSEIWSFSWIGSCLLAAKETTPYHFASLNWKSSLCYHSCKDLCVLVVKLYYRILDPPKTCFSIQSLGNSVFFIPRLLK